MITAEIKINGKLIIHVYCVNEFKVDMDNFDDDLYSYHYEMYEVGTGSVVEGGILHRRNDSGAKLIGEILKKRSG